MSETWHFKSSKNACHDHCGASQVFVKRFFGLPTTGRRQTSQENTRRAPRNDSPPRPPGFEGAILPFAQICHESSEGSPVMARAWQSRQSPVGSAAQPGVAWTLNGASYRTAPNIGVEKQQWAAFHSTPAKLNNHATHPLRSLNTRPRPQYPVSQFNVRCPAFRAISRS